MTKRLATIVLAAVAASLSGGLPAQREVTQITSSPEPHLDPQISPDGQTIAFDGAAQIGVVSYFGGTELTLVNGNGIGDFVWSPTSAGIYFLQTDAQNNDSLKFIARFGGGATTLVLDLPGQRHRLWCVDSRDRTIWGSRWDPPTPSAPIGTYHIFKVQTGGSIPIDVVSSVLVLDDVRLDPSETGILYRTFVDSTPFAPIEYFRVDLDGTNRVSWTGGALNSNPSSADWIDGQTIQLSLISPTSFFPQIGTIGPAGSPVRMVTEGGSFRRNGVVTADRSWIVHEARYPEGTAVGPAIVPPDGGGVVMLASDGQAYLFRGPPSVDGSGNRIVFAATIFGSTAPPHVFRVALDRELRIFPRAEVGGSFQATMPVDANEQGAVFLGVGLSAQLFTLPGFTYGLALDPTLLIPVVTGTSATGNLGVSISIPNIAALVGQAVFFQGLRVKGVVGDFTRYAETVIF